MLAASSPGEEIDSPIRVLLVDDHPIVLRGHQGVFDDEPDIVVVAMVTTAAEAVAMAAHLDPDVVVLPWRLGGRTLNQQFVAALAAVCRARLLVYTGFIAGVDVAAEAITAAFGGAVVVPRTAALADLVAAVRAVAARSPAEPAGRPAVPAAVPPLTPREREILPLVLAGLRNAEIAAALGVEVTTVKSHVRAVLQKFGCRTRADLRGAVTAHRSADQPAGDHGGAAGPSPLRCARDQHQA